MFLLGSGHGLSLRDALQQDRDDRARRGSAEARQVPTIVACEIVKLAPIEAASAPEQSEAEKTLFELTSPELLSEIVTEEGCHTPDEIAALVDRTPFLRDGYALLLPANAI